MASFSINGNGADVDGQHTHFFSRSSWFNDIVLREGETNVACVVLSTYRLCLKAVHDEFPQLFGHAAYIPTFLMHGDNVMVVQDENNIRYACKTHPKNLYENLKKRKNEENISLDENFDEDGYDERMMGELDDLHTERFQLQLPQNVHVVEVAPQFPRYIDHSKQKLKRNFITVTFFPQ